METKKLDWGGSNLSAKYINPAFVTSSVMQMCFDYKIKHKLCDLTAVLTHFTPPFVSLPLSLCSETDAVPLYWAPCLFHFMMQLSINANHSPADSVHWKPNTFNSCRSRWRSSRIISCYLWRPLKDMQHQSCNLLWKITHEGSFFLSFIPQQKPRPRGRAVMDWCTSERIQSPPLIKQKEKM